MGGPSKGTKNRGKKKTDNEASAAGSSADFRNNYRSRSSRNNTGLAGIDAQGATCYLNSLLQTLAHTPELRESLHKLRPDELLDAQGYPKDKERGILIEVQLLFARLLYIKYQQSYSSEDLTASLDWDYRQLYIQHDVQELYRSFLGILENSLKDTSKKKAISELYHGRVINKITCQNCQKVNEREEDFVDLTLPVTGMTKVSDSLDAMYRREENMERDDQYWCNNCNRRVDAKKSTKVRKLPPILALSLLRFHYNFRWHQRHKDTNCYEFPQEIDMKPYCDQKPDSGDGDDGVYELFSVIIHSGSTHSGHYHAYIKDVEGNGTWEMPEKTHVTYFKEETAIEELQQVLSNGKPMPIALFKEVLKERKGKVWYDQFRSRCGKLVKFLRRNDDLFFVDSVNNSVTLKETSSNSVSLKKTSGHWFDFNDSRVLPIHTDAIKDQFWGRESAYMLFYRRKNMIRKDNKEPVLPDWLSKMLAADEDDNRRSRKHRERMKREYDEQLVSMTTFPETMSRSSPGDTVNEFDTREDPSVETTKDGLNDPTGSPPTDTKDELHDEDNTSNTTTERQSTSQAAIERERQMRVRDEHRTAPNYHQSPIGNNGVCHEETMSQQLTHHDEMSGSHPKDTDKGEIANNMSINPAELQDNPRDETKLRRNHVTLDNRGSQRGTTYQCTHLPLGQSGRTTETILWSTRNQWDREAVSTRGNENENNTSNTTAEWHTASQEATGRERQIRMKWEHPPARFHSGTTIMDSPSATTNHITFHVDQSSNIPKTKHLSTRNNYPRPGTPVRLNAAHEMGNSNPREETGNGENIRSLNELRRLKNQSHMETSDMTNSSSQAYTVIQDRSTSHGYRRAEQPDLGNTWSNRALYDDDDPMNGD